MKPYYDDGKGIQIFLGDCREILPGLPKVDLVLTDPPYGMNKAVWDKFLNPDEWLSTCRITADIVLLFCGVKALFDYPRPNWIMCWERLGSTQRNGAFRGFNNWEPILLYSDGSISIPNDTLSFPNLEHESGHPTQKPLKLITKLMSLFPGGCVVDPFCGSGTTLRAAKDLGRACVGIEIEEKYCEIAARRLQQEVLDLKGGAS